MNEPNKTGQVEASKADDKIPCVVCKESILRGAKVCNHCNKDQGWTRHLTRWATMAGAAVTVLSLLSAADSLRKLTTDPANLRVIPKACQRRSLELAVTNLGDRPAMVQRVILKLKLDDLLSDKEMPLTLSKGKEMFAPHDTEMVTYKYLVHDTAAEILPPLVGVKACSYVVSIETTDFEGNSRTLPAECLCPTVEGENSE